MKVPEAFEKRLQRAFDGRLRVRWSVRNAEFVVEQRVGNAVCPPIRIEENRDDLICARDGFEYLLSVRSGTRMPCPNCEFTELPVPVRDFVDIRCPYCAMKGRPSRVVAGFWPLDDTLITHLQKLDPLRGVSKELAAAADRANQAKLAAAERAFSNEIFAAGAENYNAVAGIPSFSFTNAQSWPENFGKPAVSE